MDPARFGRAFCGDGGLRGIAVDRRAWRAPCPAPYPMLYCISSTFHPCNATFNGANRSLETVTNVLH